MKRQMTAIIEREGDGYVAPARGTVLKKRRQNLREALELFFETGSEEEIRRRSSGEVYVTQVEVGVG